MTRYLDENSGKQIVIETNKALLLKANQSEITSARKGEVDLATKIGKIDSSLSEKANKTDVANIAIGTPLFASDTTTMIDTTRVYVNTTDGLLYTYNNSSLTFESTGVMYQSTGIADKSITKYNADFINTSDNLIDYKNVNVGFKTSGVDGSLIVDSNFVTSDYIKVNQDNYYTIINGTTFSRFDIDKGFINVNTIASSPSTFNTYLGEYIRVTMPIATYLTSTLVKGSTNSAMSEFYTKLDNSIEVDGKAIINDTIDTDKVSFINKPMNLFSTRTTNDGFVIDNATGNLTINAIYSSSDFIKVDKNTNYTTDKIFKVLRYNGNKVIEANFYPTDTSRTFNTYNSMYIKVVCLITNKNIAQINKGDTLLPYEDGSLKLNSSILVPKESVLYTFDKWAYDKFIINNPSNEYFKMTTTLQGNTAIETTTYKDVYAWYDTLVALYPNYVTKTTLLNDGNGNPIQMYRFKPKQVPTVYVSNEKINTKFPKMVLVSGVHGEEKSGIMNLFNAMKQITENWSSSDVLEMLRWNCEFLVIPVVNLHGYNNNIRHNENGVDMARNFPNEEFYNNTAVLGDLTYGGETPLSEKGSQAIANVLNSEKNIVYFVSHHSFFDWTGWTNYIWNASATKLQVQLAKRLISKISIEFKKKNIGFPQDDETFLGYADNNAPFGSEAMYASSLNIHGSTFETCAKVPYIVGAQRYDDLATTLGTEAFINLLALNLIENTKYYNSIN
jgi:hypothetical protein